MSRAIEYPSSALVAAEGDLRDAISGALVYISELITEINDLKRDKADLIKQLTVAQAAKHMQPQTRTTQVVGVPASEHWMHKTMKPGSGTYE